MLDEPRLGVLGAAAAGYGSRCVRFFSDCIPFFPDISLFHFCSFIHLSIFNTVLNNHRILHGRSAFDGKRRMCGAYIGVDEYRSKLAVLRERFEGTAAEPSVAASVGTDSTMMAEGAKIEETGAGRSVWSDAL